MLPLGQWGLHERARGRKQTVDSTSKKVDLAFPPYKGKESYTSFFYLNVDLENTQNYRSFEYTPLRCFDNFVFSGVIAPRQSKENPQSGVDETPLG